MGEVEDLQAASRDLLRQWRAQRLKTQQPAVLERWLREQVVARPDVFAWILTALAREVPD